MAAFDNVRHDFLVSAMEAIGIKRATATRVMQCFQAAAVRMRITSSAGVHLFSEAAPVQRDVL